MVINWHYDPIQTELILDEEDKNRMRLGIRAHILQEKLDFAAYELKKNNLEKVKEWLKYDYKELEEEVESYLKTYWDEAKDWHFGDCCCECNSCMRCIVEEFLGIDTREGLGKHERATIHSYYIQRKEGEWWTEKPDVNPLDVIKDMEEWEPNPEHFKDCGFNWEYHVPRWKQEKVNAVKWYKEYLNIHFPGVL